MRVLMITQFYPPTIGGQERVVEDLGLELTSRGHHVAVATLQQEGLPAPGDASDVRVYPITSTARRLYRGYLDPARPHAPPVADPKAAAELRRVIELEQPDIVHGHDWLVRSFLPSKRRHGPRLVVTLHDHGLVCANKRLIRRAEACTGPGPAKCLRCAASYYGRATGPLVAIGNWTMAPPERALVDLFLPVSRAVADAARLDSHRVEHRVIPNFLPTRLANAPGGERFPGLPERFVLFVGDVSADKGVEILLEAHALLDDPPPLVLMGRTMDREILAAAVGPERASSPAVLAAPIGKVRAVGPQSHEVVLDALARCSVAVVPSVTPEAFGLAALEAMSAGRPVIASDIGGLPELISDDVDGLLVPPGDVGALRDALARVLDDKALASRIGAAAEERARDFAADRVVPRIEQAYEDVVAAQRERMAAGATAAGAAATRRVRGTESVRRGASYTILISSVVVGRLVDVVARALRPASARVAAGTRQAWTRSRRRRWPLVILALTALALAATVLPRGGWVPLRAFLAMPLVLVLPGYALTRALFRDKEPGLVERTVLALGLSIVTAGLVSLLLYVTPFELTLGSWAAGLALVTVGAVIADSARASVGADEPRSVLPHPARLLPRSPAIVALGLASAGLVAAAVVLARTPLSSPAARGYTALWLTRDPHSPAAILGVRSEEHERTRYVLQLVLPTRVTRRHLALSPGQTWQVRLPDTRRAAASLYRVGHRGVYRSVHLTSPTASNRTSS